MARSRLSCQLAGPPLATLVLFSALLPTVLATSRALRQDQAGVTVSPDVSLPDEAVSERKVMFSTSGAGGMRYNVAVFAYELTSLGGDEDGSHLSHECKKNQETMVVLLHGATYNHKYWDAPPVDGSPHSLARYLAKQCYAVIAPDGLGVGESDRPNGNSTGLEERAQATADVLRSLKTNNNPLRKHKAKSIVLVGHSLGSILAELILGTYPTIADALVTTGWTNGFEPNAPAAGNRATFDSLDSSSGYLTVPPVFHSIFYDGFDPVTGIPTPHPTSWTDAMLAYDIGNLGDVITRKEGIDTIIPLGDNRVSNSANDPTFIFNTLHTDKIIVPVFMLCGEHDIFANADGCARGGVYFPNAPSVTSFVQPSIAHAYNMHLTCVPGWEKIVEHIEAHA